MNKEVFALHQLSMEVQRKADLAKKNKDHRDVLRYYWINKGVEQSIEALKGVYFKVEKPFEG